MKNIIPQGSSASIKQSLKRTVNAFLRNSLFLFIMFSCFFSFVWALPLTRVSYGEQAAQEYELKAVYLYNFLQFVQWPDSQAASANGGAMVIGIVGESPFGDALNALQANVRKSGMKPVKIIHYGRYREDLNLSSCHLLFVSASEKKNFPAITSGLKGEPVLTVSDTENFISSGGMILFVQNKGKVRWIVNRQAVDKAGLRLSAQLLSIAVRVVEQP